MNPSGKILRSLVESRPAWRVCGEAADAIEAVEEAKRLDPKIVVMGSAIRAMDGLQTVRQIRRELPNTKIVLISETPEIAFAHALEAGADEFMTKEVIARDTAQFIAALNRACEIENPREHGLGKTLAETFPCSDPLSSIPNPDVIVGELKAALEIGMLALTTQCRIEQQAQQESLRGGCRGPEGRKGFKAPDMNRVSTRHVPGMHHLSMTAHQSMCAKGYLRGSQSLISPRNVDLSECVVPSTVIFGIKGLSKEFR